MYQNQTTQVEYNESFDDDNDAMEMMTSILEKGAIDNLK